MVMAAFLLGFTGCGDPQHMSAQDSSAPPAILKQRCEVCHNAYTPERNWQSIELANQKRDLIYERVVIRRDMPPLSFNPMTEEDRAVIAEWATSGR